MGIQDPRLSDSIPTDALEVLLNTQIIILTANTYTVDPVASLFPIQHTVEIEQYIAI